VLVLTGRDQPDDRAAAYLVKPFSSLALLDAVKRAYGRLSVDPGTSHLRQLEAAERQLVVFAHEINHFYQAERALERLRASYLDMIKTLAFVVEAKDPSTRAHLQRTHDYAVALAEAVDPELAAALRVPAPRRGQGRHPRVGARQAGAAGRHPVRGAGVLGGRRLRRHDLRPPLPQGHSLRPGLPGDRRRRRLPVRPGRGRRLHRDRPRPPRPPRRPPRRCPARRGCGRRGCGQPGARDSPVGYAPHRGAEPAPGR
jgi:hypothetical protein